MNKNTFMLSLAVIGFTWAASHQFNSDKGKNKKSEEIVLKDKLDSLNYCVGSNIGKTLKADSFPLRDKILFAGLVDVFAGGDLKISEEKGKEIIQNYFSGVQEKKMKAQKEQAGKVGTDNKKKADDFLKAHRSESGVMETPGGIQYKILKSGSGKMPTLANKVTCNYEGTLLNGNKFDSSYDRGEPATFPLGGVIKGWQDILQLMKEGDIWEVWIPPHLAYGENGAGGQIGPNELLKFKIELITVE